MRRIEREYVTQRYLWRMIAPWDFFCRLSGAQDSVAIILRAVSNETKAAAGLAYGVGKGAVPLLRSPRRSSAVDATRGQLWLWLGGTACPKADKQWHILPLPAGLRLAAQLNRLPPHIAITSFLAARSLSGAAAPRTGGFPSCTSPPAHRIAPLPASRTRPAQEALRDGWHSNS